MGLFYGLSIEIQPDPVPACLPTQHRPSVNCGISILYEIQWAFHFQHKPKLVQVSVWRQLCHEAAVCIKITLYCFDMTEAKVKIIFLLDIVSVILPRCRAAIRTSPETMWNISDTNFIFMWNYSNAAVQHELCEPNQILGSIPSSECSSDNKVLFCESVQYIKVDSLGQCVRYNTLIWAISISEAGTIKLVCCISNFFFEYLIYASLWCIVSMVWRMRLLH